MAEADPFRRYLEAGLDFAQMSRARAEAIVRDLVRAGDVGREQAQDRVEELLDRSKRGTEGLLGTIRKEIAQQLSSMGFATKEDLERLEARLTNTAPAADPKPAAAAKKARPKQAADPPRAQAAARKAAKTAATERPAAKKTAKKAPPSSRQ